MSEQSTAAHADAHLTLRPEVAAQGADAVDGAAAFARDTPGRRRSQSFGAVPPPVVLALHGAVGNRAIARLIQRDDKKSTPKAPAAGGGSPVATVINALLNPEKMQRQGDAFTFGSARLTTDATQLGPQLLSVYERAVLDNRGHEAALDSWVDHVISLLSAPAQIVDARTPSLQKTGPTTEQLAGEVKTAVEASRKWVHASHSDFIASFQARAVKQFDTVLDKSRDTVEKERARYGIKTDQTKIFGIVLSSKTVMADNDDSKAMMAAINNLQNKFAMWSAATGLDSGGLSIFLDPTEAAKKYSTEYNTARSAAEAKFPVIAAFNLDLSRGAELKSAFKQALDSPAAFIGPQITRKLENISTARNSVWEKLSRVWGFPSIVSLAKSDMGLPRGSHLDVAVDDKVKEQQEAITNRNLILGAIALGLAALSPVTGGVSGLGATALGVAMTAESVQEALLQDAMSGTDFDKAKVISKEEPNWYWVAVELIGTALDLKGALVEFKALLTVKKEVVALKLAADASKDTTAFEKGVKDLRERGNTRKAGLGDKLEQDVRMNSPAAEHPPDTVPPSSAPDTVPPSNGPKTLPDPSVIPELPGAIPMRFTDEVRAHAVYNSYVKDIPKNEVALAFCPKTNEWTVIRGEADHVSLPKEMFVDGANTWSIVKHYHPGEASMMRVPSKADFAAISGQNPGKAWESIVEYTNPVTNRKRYTYFGHDPADAAAPYWIKYMDPAEKGPGAVVMKRFAKGPHTPEGLVDYENFITDIEKKNAALSNGPNTVKPTGD